MRADYVRAKRLLDVTRKLEVEARTRLAALQADAATVVQARDRLLAGLVADHPLHFLFTAARGRKLAALSVEEQKLVAAKAACAQEVISLEGRRRICERRLEAAGAALRREEEARQLDESIARLARERIASPE